MRSKWEVFIARAMIEGYLKTGSVNSGGENMSLSHNGREVNESHFQVLTNPHGVALQWLSADWTSLPKTAIVGGMWEGKAVYIGRKKHSLHGDTVVGHVVAGDGALWYSWKGKEYVTTEFEILTSPSCPIAEKVGRSTEEKPSRTAWDAAAFMYNYQRKSL